jgi:ATP-dependent DNA ligase
MEARLAGTIPAGDEWSFEPKWDGFRCLAFRDGDAVDLRSKAGKPLARYFPEVVEVLRNVETPRFVLDGELVVPSGGVLLFDELLQRIHPAASRIRKLATERPAHYIVFDLLVDDGSLLADQSLEERLRVLARFAGENLNDTSLHRSPATRDVQLAERWLSGEFGGLDGVMAKRLDLPYQSGERTGMLKIKRMRTADCVIGGFRWAKDGKSIGSVLLGLYGDDGLLHHVGFCSAMNAALRSEVTARVVPLRRGEGFTGRSPGGPSRWRSEGEAAYESLRPELVVEVEYDHFTGGRFRHGTRFGRWRPDKAPDQCTLDQIERESAEAMEMFDE